MKPFHKLALTLIALALLASNATAQLCGGGKVVHFQVPPDWTSPFYYRIDNTHAVTVTIPADRWVTFTITEPNYVDNTKGFLLTRVSAESNQGIIVSKNGYNVQAGTGGYNPAGKGFFCSDFGTGNDIYISENPNNPGVTVVGTEPPNAYHFYFLPPSDPEWTLGSPYLVWNDGSGIKKEKLALDVSRCGWFKKTWFNVLPPSGTTLIWLNEDATDQLGLLGFGEDQLDWVDGMPTPFNLLQQFQDVVGGPGNLFFMPAIEGSNIWRTTDGGQTGVCSYSFAAVIYDTDYTVSSSFHLGGEGQGIIKGIPGPVLAPDADGIMKMTWGGLSGSPDGWTQTNFIDAFKPTTGKNIVRCYDLPFMRNKEGLWEFNSNKLCGNGSMDLDGTCSGRGGYMGGFFPPEMQTAGGANYASCTACQAPRAAGPWVPLNNTISQYCYDRGHMGTATGPNGTCGRAFGAGDMLNGTTPEIWDWGNRVTMSGGATTKNAFYCFESSPAEFTYSPGQEFFFSGDDDIWVYISNYRVIDLGGTHLASPGYVNLDTLRIPANARIGDKKYGPQGQLIADEKYPINIFFCDRRTDMSNVRISTDMYFASKNSLSVSGNVGGTGGEVCLDQTTPPRTCDCVMNPTKPECQPGSLKCGNAMGNILDYYMVSRRGETLDLNPNNPQCRPVGNDLVCYGGVTLVDYYTTPVGAVAKVKTTNSLFTLMGSYKIYAKINEANEPIYGKSSVYIGTVYGEPVEVQIWGRIVNDDTGELIYDLGPKHKRTVAGKRVPLGYSVGGWECDVEERYGNADCPFRVFMETADNMGALGASVNIIRPTAPSPGGRDADLLWFTDSIGGSPIPAPTYGTIPANNQDAQAQGHSFRGLLIYWVTGEYTAADDQEHKIGASLQVDVVLPRLAFINPEDRQQLGADMTQGSEWPRPAGVTNFRNLGIMIGESTPRAVVAYDVSGSSPVVCTTCNFKLGLNAWLTEGTTTLNTPSNSILQAMPNPPDLKDGYADFNISGRMSVPGINPLDNKDSLAHFTVGVQFSAATRKDILGEWKNLIFEKPEVPYPSWVAIYDVNGDGYGDSLRIAYDRKFMNRTIINDELNPPDSLPSKIEVYWDPDPAFNATLIFGTGIWKDDTKSWTSTGNPAVDVAYWTSGNSGVKDFKIKVEYDSVLVIYGDNFSKNIKTSAGSNASVISWATFKNTKAGATSAADFPLSANISDSIPAIVVKALYVPGENCSGSGPGAGVACPDQVTITVSEPVRILDAVAPPVDKAPFAYWLGTRGFNLGDFRQFTEQKNLPVRFSRSLDSIFHLTYERYRSSNDTTNTPMAGDSVKFVYDGLGQVVLVDLVGNRPNPKEIGRPLEGTNPFNVDEIRITELDPERNPGLFEEAVNNVLGGKAPYPFNPSNPITLLPAHGSWTADSIRKYYPSSVGQYLTPDVKNVVDRVQMDLSNGTPITADDITFYAKAYYHTNLGNFVVESKKIEIKCSDPIFTVFGENCMGALPKGIYLAWNLKDAKNRWAGAGAYVEVYDFWWEVKYIDKSGQLRTLTQDKIEQRVAMHGVKRAKKKK